MGDRALVVFADKKTGDVSPTVYLHWLGHKVPDLLKEHKVLMGDRVDDVSYAAARFIGVCHQHHSGATGLGVFDTPADFMKDPGSHTHGDAGVVVVDAASYEWEAFGGYLEKKPSLTPG